MKKIITQSRAFDRLRRQKLHLRRQQKRPSARHYMVMLRYLFISLRSVAGYAFCTVQLTSTLPPSTMNSHTTSRFIIRTPFLQGIRSTSLLPMPS